MPAETYLFIGGSHDGRRIPIGRPGSLHRIEEFEKPRQHFSEKMEFRPDHVKQIEIYRRELVRVGSKDVVHFYVHDSIDAEGAFLLLVANYHGRTQRF